MNKLRLIEGLPWYHTWAVVFVNLRCSTLISAVKKLFERKTEEAFTTTFWFFFFCCRVTEFADHLHEHFIHPCAVENGAYKVPMVSFWFFFFRIVIYWSLFHFLTITKLKQHNKKSLLITCIVFVLRTQGIVQKWGRNL